MLSKTYGQFCPIARALDVLGERWTLLVVRELLLGPRRFKALLAVLPSMGANRLSARLKVLVDSEVAELTAAPHAAYRLTPFGEGLRPPLLALGIWGLGLPVDERAAPDTLRAELIALSLSGIFRPPAAATLAPCFEFQVGAEVFHLRLAGERLLAQTGPAPEPAVVVRCPIDAFVSLALRKNTPSALLATAGLELLQGEPAALEALFQAFDPAVAGPPGFTSQPLVLPTPEESTS